MMVDNNSPPAMTVDKAHWTAIATALTSIVLALAGATGASVEGFASDVKQLLTLVAAIAIQAGVAWATTYFKRNRPK